MKKIKYYFSNTFNICFSIVGFIIFIAIIQQMFFAGIKILPVDYFWFIIGILLYIVPQGALIIMSNRDFKKYGN